ncbi:peptidoglycan-binding protein [Nonomuraea africana]|uniref:peptidoglycan-binding protein n=1 Tax=Nonomuraea africana TaxID=46171 RepID=UPI00340D205C
MRKGLIGAGLLTVAATCTAVALLGRGETSTATPGRPPTPTATITRQDLVDTKTVDGSLTYSGERDVNPDVSGTVTWVAAEGAVIRRGHPLLKVDRRPVVLMYGKLPLYRELRQGISDGPDIEQLERNLQALGHGDGLTVDEHFSYATHLAVKQWQDDQGLPATGKVDAAQVVFLPAAARVTAARVALGVKTRPGQRVLTVSGVRRLVHVDLGTGDQALARKGAKVTVELPGGERATGRITSVGAVARSSESAPGQDGATTIDVDITLDESPRTKLDQAPVEVEMESERRGNVLAVPVEALLALREGGYGVEVVEGAATRLVTVRTGGFGGGLVEISGAGLREGMKVGVPAA